jgi:hypothetical protein
MEEVFLDVARGRDGLVRAAQDAGAEEHQS